MTILQLLLVISSLAFLYITVKTVYNFYKKDEVDEFMFTLVIGIWIGIVIMGLAYLVYCINWNYKLF